MSPGLNRLGQVQSQATLVCAVLLQSQFNPSHLPSPRATSPASAGTAGSRSSQHRSRHGMETLRPAGSGLLMLQKVKLISKIKTRLPATSQRNQEAMEERRGSTSPGPGAELQDWNPPKEKHRPPGSSLRGWLRLDGAEGSCSVFWLLGLRNMSALRRRVGPTGGLKRPGRAGRAGGAGCRGWTGGAGGRGCAWVAGKPAKRKTLFVILASEAHEKQKYRIRGENRVLDRE